MWYTLNEDCTNTVKVLTQFHLKESLYMLKTQVPKSWAVWYDAVLELTIEGKTNIEIGEKLHRHPVVISRVKSMPMFMDKYRAKFGKNSTKILAYLKEHTKDLLDNKLNLALSAESESVRSEATSWLLEKIPEFSPKANQYTQQTNIYQGSKEDDERLDCISGDMRKVIDRLRDGNEFVEKPVTEITDITKTEGEGDTNDTLVNE